VIDRFSGMSEAEMNDYFCTTEVLAITQMIRDTSDEELRRLIELDPFREEAVDAILDRFPEFADTRRLLEIDGVVRFAGINLRDASLLSLRRRICVVPQEGFLFNGTIRENVRIAKAGATDTEVDAALEAVGVLERFAGLAEGLDTEVRERGSRLSAGEKQLVSLARAALADPAVLVLDEATSSLDPGTEVLVEAALERLMEGRTVVVIAHRLSTAERADRIGVVDAGGLVELGTHDDLVALGGRYAALYANWAGRLTAVPAGSAL